MSYIIMAIRQVVELPLVIGEAIKQRDMLQSRTALPPISELVCYNCYKLHLSKALPMTKVYNFSA